MKTKFIGYTVGLNAIHENLKKYMLLKAEFARLPNGDVQLTCVSARNLERIRSIATRTISAEEFSDRPSENIGEAHWAFRILGVDSYGMD